jgi:hypothetical protein
MMAMLMMFERTLIIGDIGGKRIPAVIKIIIIKITIEINEVLNNIIAKRERLSHIYNTQFMGFVFIMRLYNGIIRSMIFIL